MNRVKSRVLREWWSVMLVVGIGLAAVRPLRNAAMTILRFPFTCLHHGVRALLLIPQLPTISRQRVELTSDLMRARLEAIELREALRHIRQGLELLTREPSGVIAEVIGYSMIPTQHTVLLNKGRRDGLLDHTVIMDAEGLVGRVIELHADTTLVMLLTDANSRVAGTVERSRDLGLVVGQGWNRCAFLHLEADADIQAGDRLLTAGLEGSLPKGLPLGIVTRIVRDETSGSARADVVPSAHLSRLETVLCLPRSGRRGDEESMNRP